MLKLIRNLILGALIMLCSQVRAAEPTAEIKSILIHGITMYIEANYYLAIEDFKKVLKLDSNNELAQQYIQSSRQRISEHELVEKQEDGHK